MNKKIIIPLLVLTIIVMSTVFLFTSNILVLDTSQEITKINLKSITPEKLSTNLIKSVKNMCSEISSVENSQYCDSMNFIFTGFVSIFPSLDSDNKFDAQYCEKVDKNLYLLDKLMYRDNYQNDEFFDLPDEELRKKVTMTILEKNQINQSHYDVTYDFIESIDEFLLFWNDAYNISCKTT